MTRLRSLTLVLCVLLSCLGWLGYVALGPERHAWGDLERGRYTDHFSHMNAARAFARIGFDIYRSGPKHTLPELHPALVPQLPADLRAGASSTGGLYLLPGVGPEKPWATSWSDRPRLYPPGDLLLVAPVALLYDQTALSFTDACRLLIALFVVYAHISLYVAYRWLAPQLRLSTPVLWLCAAVFYFEVVHWSLEGFYDVAVLAPLVFCVAYLRERRAIAAALAYCIAAACHFRVFFLGPLALYALWIFIADKQWRGLRRRDYAALAAVGALSLVSLGVFALIQPALDMPITNAAHPSLWAASMEPVMWLLSVSLLCLLVMLFARAWFDVALLFWLSMTLLALNEAAPWHALVPMVWLLAPVYQGRAEGAEAVRLARLGLLWFASFWLLRGQFWPDWLPWLWRA